jgi:hypothetical protein
MTPFIVRDATSVRLDRSFQTDARAKPAHPDGGAASGALRGAGCYGLEVEQEDEQREEPAGGDEDAHPSKVGRRCFEPVSAL